MTLNGTETRQEVTRCSFDSFIHSFVQVGLWLDLTSVTCHSVKGPSPAASRTDISYRLLYVRLRYEKRTAGIYLARGARNTFVSGSVSKNTVR